MNNFNFKKWKIRKKKEFERGAVLFEYRLEDRDRNDNVYFD